MPPLSGKILWAHQLYKHLEGPIQLLKAKKGLLLSAQGKALVKKYNNMALVLVQYEIVHYQSWVSNIECAHQYLQVGAAECAYLCIDYSKANFFARS